MIILDKPYISQLLEETLIKYRTPVLVNSAGVSMKEKMNLIGWDELISRLSCSADPRLYLISEDSMALLSDVFKKTDFGKTTLSLKNKISFREATKKLYPHFFFHSDTLAGLKKTEAGKLKYPLIIKPSLGICSAGVHKINNAAQWKTVIGNLGKEAEDISRIFSDSVVDVSCFIIEEYIHGDEYAVDAYYDKDGKPVILNILMHPFTSTGDTSDRLYYTSKEIILSFYDVFLKELEKLGLHFKLKNYPVHVEFRISADNTVLPIEVNPLRFTGWCATDIAYYAFGINPHEAYLENKRPDWDEILGKMSDDYFCINEGGIPGEIDVSAIKRIDFEEFLKMFSNVLEVRKINYLETRVFVIVFSRTKNYEELENFLRSDLSKYIETRQKRTICNG